jgi:hypothetical protein
VATEDLALSIKRTLERKRLLDLLDLEKRDDLPSLDNEEPFRPIITQSKKVLRILKEAELHAASLVPVLITGESGTGKELAGPRHSWGQPARAASLYAHQHGFVDQFPVRGRIFRSHQRGLHRGRKRSGRLSGTHQQRHPVSG